MFQIKRSVKISASRQKGDYTTSLPHAITVFILTIPTLKFHCQLGNMPVGVPDVGCSTNGSLHVSILKQALIFPIKILFQFSFPKQS
jgi:hypothetical protein